MPDLADLFGGFESHWIDVRMGRIFARAAGKGPPLMLLHGFPQTHVCWHRVAPILAERYRLIIMDMRGYGWSSAPASHAGALYAKRVMAQDVVEAMGKLGHARFAFAGHDRGARIGYRLALDQPGRVERLILLDILPTFHVWGEIRAGRQPGRHWEFLARPEPEPETAIARDPAAYVDGLLTKWNNAKSLDAFDSRALAHYRAAANEPSRIHAFCEDYRAGATLDCAADEADLAAGKKIACPVLALTGEFYLTGGMAATRDVWKKTFAPHVEGAQIACGHFLAEEAPQETAAALIRFMSA
jgi:haloacetate dehalogenase